MGRIGTVLMWSVAFVACVWLAGCASDGGQGDKQSVKAETPNPVSVDIVPQYDTDPTKAIDTSHLPKKTIQTPWGPREIPDQSKNPELIAIVTILERYYSNNQQRELSVDDWRYFSKVASVQSIDYLRLGCAKLRDNGCALNRYLFIEDCGDKHAIGSSSLSECEKKNQRWIVRNAIGYKSCKINGADNTPFFIEIKERRDLTTSQRVTNLLKAECIMWRGQPDWNLGISKIKMKN